MMLRRTSKLCLSLLLLLVGAFAQAQQGQALTPILIGQSAAFTGPAAASVQEGTEGARLYLDAVNAQGGVRGQRIELASLDDRYDPTLAAANTKRLIEQGVLAMFLSRGTAPTQAMLPLLAEHRLALVAPGTGARALREPLNPYVFNLRASFQREADRAVRHLAGLGIRRITLVQADDEFGSDAGTGALRALEALNLRPTAVLRYDPRQPQLGALMQQLARAEAEGLLLIGPAYAAVEGINALRAAGSKAQVATLSNNASADFVRALGANARGVIVTQLFPYERSQSTALVHEAQTLARARGRGELTPAGVEGFAAAKLLVEGLRRAGKDLSREGLLKALDALQQVDLGGLQLSIGPKNHAGLDFADVSVIGADGRFLR